MCTEQCVTLIRLNNIFEIVGHLIYVGKGVYYLDRYAHIGFILANRPDWVRVDFRFCRFLIDIYIGPESHSHKRTKKF